MESLHGDCKREFDSEFAMVARGTVPSVVFTSIPTCPVTCDGEGWIGHRAELVDTTGNRKGEQYPPLEVDMDPDWPRGDIPNHSGALAPDMFDFGRRQHHLELPDGGKPRWFGHGLSLPPDTDMHPGTAEQVVGLGTARHSQGATRPTYLDLAQRRQEAGIWIPTGFESENNPGPESSHGYLPRGGAQTMF